MSASCIKEGFYKISIDSDTNYVVTKLPNIEARSKCHLYVISKDSLQFVDFHYFHQSLNHSRSIVSTMMQNSSLWSPDAFKVIFIVNLRCIRVFFAGSDFTMGHWIPRSRTLQHVSAKHQVSQFRRERGRRSDLKFWLIVGFAP